MNDHIRDIYTLFLRNPVITIDSRMVPEGSVFFALRGEHFDGNHFAADALSHGASFAVVDNPECVSDARCILVDNVLAVLQQLAQYHRSRFSIPVIAVTGSNGKTTTKELISAILEKKYRTVATRGNLNNHIGVPLTLLNINNETEITVVEMGANHPGEIRTLCSLAMPDHGLVTNIGKAHLEGFGSQEGVRKAKKELYDHLAETGGIVFRNDDDSVLKELDYPADRIISYGTKAGSVQQADITAMDPFLQVIWKDTTAQDNKAITITTRLAGSYNLHNVLAALAVARYFNVDRHTIVEAVEAYQPSNMRSQIIRQGTNLWLLDAYNANPSSMIAALKDFTRFSHPNKILILGDMLELGHEEDAEHRAVISFIEKATVNTVCLVGPVFKRNNRNTSFYMFDRAEQLAEWLKTNPPRDAFILVKGSRLIKLEKIFDTQNK